MKGNILFNPDKAGTIILSHYRSGGTQMKNFVCGICSSTDTPFLNCGEFDLNLKEDLSKQVENYFVKVGEYKVILLNNPISIGYLISSGWFDIIAEQYNIIRVYRKDKKRTLLSLPVWEKLIQENLFARPQGYPPEDMDNFGCMLEENPLHPYNIHLGLGVTIETVDQVTYLNSALWLFTQSLMVLDLLEFKYKIPSVCYEEYEEFNEEFYINYLQQYEDTTGEYITQPIRSLYEDTYSDKIPYMVDDLEVYFDSIVQKAVREWKI
jgi:hypothetical protein